MTNIRVGNGYDVHQLKENLPFILGGVPIKYNKGIVAHSDGDVLLHAISDALLGAASLGDIGHFFLIVTQNLKILIVQLFYIKFVTS